MQVIKVKQAKLKTFCYMTFDFIIVETGPYYIGQVGPELEILPAFGVVHRNWFNWKSSISKEGQYDSVWDNLSWENVGFSFPYCY